MIGQIAPDHESFFRPSSLQYTPRMTEALLSVRGVVKRFGGLEALAGCTFAVRPGTITGLIGPNGAGKTTVFNVITGLLPRDSGEIHLGGTRLDGLPADRIARLGVGRTFQIPRPLARMTVIENLLVYGQAQAGESLVRVLGRRVTVSREEASLRRRASEILELMDLSALAHERAEVLSGGQKKLLELARLLMADPRIILLDEPGAGVNPTLLQSLVARIRDLQTQGRTFLVIEHDMDLVTALCDPVIVLVGGRTLVEGPFEEVRRDPRVLEAYLGSAA